jgi:mono/diheme cytochrome c family protein
MNRLYPLVCFLILGAMPAAAETPVERGKYLAGTIMTCVHCHTPLGDGGPDMSKALAGGRKFVEDAFTVYASNITPDPETGIGRWTNEQLKAAIVEGVRPDGSRLAPIMPSAYYRALLPEDLDALVAYLRSVAPVENAVPAPDYRQEMHPEEPPPGFGTPPTPADLAAPAGRGRYLVAIGRCMECHSRPGPDGRADFATGYGAGGATFEGPWGVSVAPDITASRSGLADWSDAEIARAITEGIGRDGEKLKPPMAYRAYSKLKPEDVADIVAYLRTVPAAE